MASLGSVMETSGSYELDIFLISKLPAGLQHLHSAIDEKINQYVTGGLFLLQNCVMPVPVTDQQLVQSLLNILESFLVQFIRGTTFGNIHCYVEIPKINVVQDSVFEYRTFKTIWATQRDSIRDALAANNAKQLKALDAIFAFSMIWSLGAVIDKDSRLGFEQFIRYDRRMFNVCRNKMRDTEASFPIPAESSVYDYYFSFPALKWRKWMEDEFFTSFSLKGLICDQAIPSLDNAARLYLADMLLEQVRC